MQLFDFMVKRFTFDEIQKMTTKDEQKKNMRELSRAIMTNGIYLFHLFTKRQKQTKAHTKWKQRQNKITHATRRPNEKMPSNCKQQTKIPFIFIEFFFLVVSFLSCILFDCIIVENMRLKSRNEIERQTIDCHVKFHWMLRELEMTLRLTLLLLWLLFIRILFTDFNKN